MLPKEPGSSRSYCEAARLKLRIRFRRSLDTGKLLDPRPLHNASRTIRPHGVRPECAEAFRQLQSPLRAGYLGSCHKGMKLHGAARQVALNCTA